MTKEMAGCRFDDLYCEIFIWNFQSDEKPLFNLCLGRDGAKSTLVHNGIEYNLYTKRTLCKVGWVLRMTLVPLLPHVEPSTGRTPLYISLGSIYLWTMIALEYFFFRMNIPMPLHIWFCWKTFSTNITFERFWMCSGTCVCFQFFFSWIIFYFAELTPG